MGYCTWVGTIDLYMEAKVMILSKKNTQSQKKGKTIWTTICGMEFKAYIGMVDVDTWNAEESLDRLGVSIIRSISQGRLAILLLEKQKGGGWGENKKFMHR